MEEYFPNGYFIDGFVLLTDPEEETTGNVPLMVPFFAHDLSQPYGMKNFDRVIEVELKLKNGINDFTFEVIDLAEHKTVQKVSVMKKPPLGNGGKLYDNKKPLPGSDELQPGIQSSFLRSQQ